MLPESPVNIPPAPHHHHPRLILTAGICGAIAGVVVLLIIFMHVTLPPLYSTSTSRATFPGNLLLSFSAPWKAPDNEVFTGLVAYDPAKGGYSNLTIPQQGIIFSYTKGSISPDGTKILVTQMSATSSALAVYSLSLQRVSTVLDREPSGTQFTSLNWSGDGSEVSYMVLPMVNPQTIATDGKPFLTLQDGKYTSRTGAQLPKTSQIGGYVISSDGTHKISLGGAIEPNSFSPNGAQVLAAGPGLMMVSLADGSQKTVDRPTDGSFPTGTSTSLIFDPNGAYIGALGKTGPLVVYRIDWSGAKLVHVGTTTSRPASAMFGAKGQLLSFEGTPQQAILYTFATSSTAMTRQAYSLTLPGSAQLLGWTAQ